MKLSGIDANLLAALDALLREKSVTRAAQRIGVGQPALSHSLSRLRHHFKDELLVLKGRTYVLTQRAERLSPIVANAARALAEVFQNESAFEASTSTYAFVIACSDLVGMAIIPELLRTIEREAQHVALELRALLPSSTESVLDGGVDLAIGMFEEAPTGIQHQLLYEDRAVCLVRADHELIGERMTLDDYEALPHLELTASGDALPGVQVDRALAALGRRRRVTLRVPYGLLVPAILERVDHVVTLSAGAASALATLAPLRVVEPPLALPNYAFSQIWHADRHADDGHAWLRESLSRICRDLARRAA